MSDGKKTDYYDFTDVTTFEELVRHFEFNQVEASLLQMVLMVAVIRVTGDAETLDYAIRDASDVDTITEDLGMFFSEGTVMKSLIGIAKARATGMTRHDGTSSKRDMNKVRTYVDMISKRIGD